jgi:hypothetical protein
MAPRRQATADVDRKLGKRHAEGCQASSSCYEQRHDGKNYQQREVHRPRNRVSTGEILSHGQFSKPERYGDFREQEEDKPNQANA